MRKLKEHVDDLLLLGGIACITYGVGQIYVPAAWIVGGIQLICLAFLFVRASQPIVEIETQKDAE